jgi:hypothetical protein
MTVDKKPQAQVGEPSVQYTGYAQIVGGHPKPNVVGLPKGWGETFTGEPMPNVVAAVRRVRDGY